MLMLIAMKINKGARGRETEDKDIERRR